MSLLKFKQKKLITFNDKDSIANSEDPGQTVHTVSESALFAKTCMH